MTGNPIPQWEGDWVGTNTGRVVRLDQCPQVDQITIEDIATGLSNVCRFNGQIKQWYSVAEHSIHVAELVPKEYKLQALLHDATEAYICDVPTPLKRMLGAQYAAVEERVADSIGAALKVDLLNLPDCVKMADRIMLLSERDYLQEKPGDWGSAYNGVLRYPNFRRVYENPLAARGAFMRMYINLKANN